ncbi:hypothetical protein ACLI4Q_19870 [Natrialbaceae archaeon A-CW1-1]
MPIDDLLMKDSGESATEVDKTIVQIRILNGLLQEIVDTGLLSEEEAYCVLTDYLSTWTKSS